MRKRKPNDVVDRYGVGVFMTRWGRRFGEFYADDIEQMIRLRLARAAKSWPPDGGSSFTSYAYGALKIIEEHFRPGMREHPLGVSVTDAEAFESKIEDLVNPRQPTVRWTSKIFLPYLTAA